MQDITAAISREVAGQASGQAREAGDAAFTLFTQSKLAVNGLLLALVGFFGIFGALTLQLQQAIISSYVLLFGLVLICFAAGWRSELLQKYFGFVYRPGGQLALLLIAGNLAWSTGVLGILVAIFINLTAIASWYTTPEGKSLATVLPLPDWVAAHAGSAPDSRVSRASRASSGTLSGTTGITDYGVRRDELL